MLWMIPVGLADAQTFDAAGPVLPPQRTDLTAPAAGFGGAPYESATASLTLEAASATLVRQLVDGDTVVTEPVVGSLFGMELGARANLHRRMEIGLTAPVWFAADGVATGAAGGDLHLWAPIRVLDRGPLDLAAVPFVRLPTGASARYLGDPFGAGVLASVGSAGEHLFAHADLGLDASRGTDSEDWAGGVRSRFAGDVGAGWASAALHAELRGRAPLGVSVASVPTEALLGVRLRPADPVTLSLSGGRAVTRGVGAGSLRMLASLTVRFDPPEGSGPVFADEAPRSNVREVNVIDEKRLPVRGATVRAGEAEVVTDYEGFADLPLRAVRSGELTVSAPGYLPQSRPISTEDPYWEIQLVRAPVPVAVNVVGPEGPLTDAVVTITGPADPGGSTFDEYGVETFQLSEGRWTVVVEAEGYGRQERTVVVDEARVDPLRVDAVLAALETPGTELRVQVVDGLGRPVEDAVVALENRDLGTTGTGGDLTVQGIKAGEHAIVVRSTRYGQAVVKEVVVPKDGTKVIQVPLDWQAGSVLVQVAGPDGRPTDAKVEFKGPEALPERAVGPDGEELFVLRPGRWEVEVRSDTLAPQSRTVVVDDVPGKVLSLDLVLQAAEGGRSDLELRVVDPDGLPVDAMEISLDGRTVGRTGPDGTLALRDLQAGVRFVEVKGALVVPRLTEVELVGELQREDVIVWWVDGVVDLTVTGPAGRPLDGTITPFGGSEYPPFHVGSDGFERRVFPAGTWAFQASAEGMEPRARSVEVVEDTHRKQVLQFRLEPPVPQVGRLTVVIRDADGNPVPRAEVFLGGQSAGEATQGFFQLDGVPRGALAVEVRAPAMATTRVDATVEEKTEVSVAPAWAPGAVRLEVTGPDGPLDARIEAVGPGGRRVLEATGGRALVALSPGSWTLSASAEALTTANQTVTLPDAPTLTAVAFTLAAPKPVVVLDVRRPDDTPVANASVEVGGVRVGQTDAAGQLRLDALPAGAESRVTIASTDPTLEPIEVAVKPTAGEQKHSLVLPYAPREVQVVAVDTAGEKVAIAVTAYGDETTTSTVDGQGTVELAPGTWTVTGRTDDGRVGTARVTVPEDRAAPAKVEVVVDKVTSSEQRGVLRPESPILFDLDSAVLRPDAALVVDDLARWLKADRTSALVEVAGHTDDQGGVAYNQQLSEQRAQAVRKALVARGVAPERLVARGYGLSRPVSSSTAEAGRQANRRVELVVLRKAGE